MRSPNRIYVPVTLRRRAMFIDSLARGESPSVRRVMFIDSVDRGGSPSVRRAMSNLNGYSIQEHMTLLTEGDPPRATESINMALLTEGNRNVDAIRTCYCRLDLESPPTAVGAV